MHDLQHPGLPTFWIAKYPITYSQFEVFVEDLHGYRDPRCWERLADDQSGKTATRWQQRWPVANRPRENVTWYEVVAFCRWLTAQAAEHPELLPAGETQARLGKDWSIRLPTEQEWVKAACGWDDRMYPWGGQEYRVGYANVNETEKKVGPNYLQQTSTVGMYPHGASPFGVEDMSGNVWEYCLNEYDDSANFQVDGDKHRAVRGGAWYWNSTVSSVATRVGGFDLVAGLGGFRVVFAASP